MTTFSGTVASGHDAYGYFGAVGANLAGQTFSASYTFDTSLGISYEEGGGHVLAGGPDLGLPHHTVSPGSSSITISGGTLTQSGALGSSVGDFAGFISVLTRTTLTEGGLIGDLTFQALESPVLPIDISSAGSVSGACSRCYGYFSTFQDNGFINLTPTTFSVEISADWIPSQGPQPTLVPEPAAWALMIAGFGLAGAGLRRRRVAV